MPMNTEAYLAGARYFNRNRPCQASFSGLASCARSCGWHSEDMFDWLVGFYDAKLNSAEAEA